MPLPNMPEGGLGASASLRCLSQPTFAFELGAPRKLASSPGVTHSFCGSCGSALTYGNAMEAGFIDIMTVTLDEPDACLPTCHVWTSQKIAWEVIADGLPTYEEGRE